MAKFELEQVNTLWFMTLGVTAVSAGVLVYVLLLQSALGAFSIKEFYEADRLPRKPPRIALLDSDYTRQLPPIDPSDSSKVWIDALQYSWQVFLQSPVHRTTFSRIHDNDLETGNLLKHFDVLILPAALALSDRQLENIKTYMATGGSVMASWKTGYYRPDGSVRGWSFVEEVFGVRYIDEVDRFLSPYRAYRATYPGITEPGQYVPISLAETASDSLQPVFAPLRGYRRVDASSAPPLPHDYAVADTLLALLPDSLGTMRPQRATQVTYYTWNGPDEPQRTLRPRSPFGKERFSLLGNTPLTYNLPSGFGVDIQVYDPVGRFRITDPQTQAAGYWQEAGFDQDEVYLPERLGLVFGAYGDGRFLYSAYRRDAISPMRDTDLDNVLVDRMFINAIRYLRRRPTMWVRQWPAPYSAVALLAGIDDGSTSNLRIVADSLTRDGARASFFLRPGRAELHEDEAVRLTYYHEVGLLDDLANSTDGPLHVQDARLRQLKQFLENTLQADVTSYRPAVPGQISPITLRALQQNEFETVLPDSTSMRSSPRVDISFPQLLQFTSNNRNEYDILIPENDPTYDELITPLIADAMRVKLEGGMYQLVFSSTGLGSPQYSRVLTSLTRTLKQERFWVTNSRELEKWWRLRQGVQVQLDNDRPSRLVVHISNQNGEPVRQLGITIDMGRSVEDVRIRPELISGPVPKYEMMSNNTQLSLKVGLLKPQQTRLFHIDLLETNRTDLLTSR